MFCCNCPKSPNFSTRSWQLWKMGQKVQQHFVKSDLDWHVKNNVFDKKDMFQIQVMYCCMKDHQTHHPPCMFYMLIQYWYRWKCFLRIRLCCNFYICTGTERKYFIKGILNDDGSWLSLFYIRHCDPKKYSLKYCN